MNLYICTKITQDRVDVVCVVASNELHARDILKNDGRNSFEIETYFPLSNEYSLKDSGIPYSIDVEQEK